jgi:hypothetical protein
MERSAFLAFNPLLNPHSYPGDKLDVEFTDFVELPTNIEVEKVTGHSAILTWSSGLLNRSIRTSQ